MEFYKYAILFVFALLFLSDATKGQGDEGAVGSFKQAGSAAVNVATAPMEAGALSLIHI